MNLSDPVVRGLVSSVIKVLSSKVADQVSVKLFEFS